MPRGLSAELPRLLVQWAGPRPVESWRRGNAAAKRFVVLSSCLGFALGLGGCSGDVLKTASQPVLHDVNDPALNANLAAHFPTAMDSRSGPSGTSQPLIFPGLDRAPPSAAPGSTATGSGAPARVASAVDGAVATGNGVEFNFDNADISAVAKTLLGDVLQANYIVDPRVQGNVTLASVGPIPRKNVLPVFESVLRMQNAAIVRDGNLVKIVPLPEASGSGNINVNSAQPGYGVSIVPLRYTSANTVSRVAESFLTRPGAIRADPSGNILLIQGTAAERQVALEMVANFDVEWMQNQSVGIYPLKATDPETMVKELERVFETADGGRGQGVIQFQPITRMNAVMAVAKSAKVLERATQWVARLDRLDSNATTVRTYRLKYGVSTQIAKVLNDLFLGKSAATNSAASQVAPGSNAGKSRLDSLDSNSSNGSSGQSSTGQPLTSGTTTGGSGSSNPISAAFESFADKGAADDDKNSKDGSGASGGTSSRGLFQNVRISADSSNNSIVIYSNQDDYRLIENAVRELDRPPLQVAIEATVAEVTLTDDLNYGVQYYLSSHDLGLGHDNGAVGQLSTVTPSTTSTTASGTTTSVVTAAATTAQSALLSSVGPGFNLLLGPDSNPRAIINALSTITNVKVLSSPSLVVLDNQPALLQVGDEVPITTSSATLLTTTSTVVNSINMVNTGVILKVLPHVHANGSVQLEIEQEISNVVNPSQQTLTPTISQRRVHSTVAVTSGQTVMLGGLISDSDSNTKSGIPGLNQVQYLGDLFGNTTKSKQRQEIVIFIKPQLIRNGVDARDVAEEFRRRLRAMHGWGDEAVPRPTVMYHK
jgi:general secretion pathway protein D